MLGAFRRASTSFRVYKHSLAWFAKLQKEGLADLDAESGKIALSDKIPEAMMGESLRAAEAYGKTFLWLSKAASYTRMGCIGIFAYIGYQVFFAQ